MNALSNSGKVRMSNIGAYDNHKLLSYHDNEPLRYDYHTIDIIAHH